MRVTNVEVSVNHRGCVRAFCKLTFDNEFVIQDVKLIETDRGTFVAMPNRRTTGHCPHCAARIATNFQYCCSCGSPVDQASFAHDREYCDIAHPINRQCREMIEEAVKNAVCEASEKNSPVLTK
ncbi:MAG TPA: hypothetical protein DCG12_22080 [Planctomycetaceae bacterium]|nr:hypothetical protein [Planctomycetaceae bacterium]